MSVQNMFASVVSSMKGSSQVMDSMIVGIVMILLTVIVLSIIYILRSLKSSKSRQISLISTPVDLSAKKGLPYNVSGANIPTVSQGKSFSFSFWLYLSDTYTATTDHKILMIRGNNSSLPAINFSANPLIFLDRTTNKMYIAISTSNVTRTDMSLDDVLAMDVSGNYVSGYIITQINYVPMQRWVSFVVSIQDDIMMVFIDSDMYTVNSVSDAMFSSGDTRPIIRGSSGDVSIGDVVNSCAGFLTKLVYTNTAVNASSINNMYSSGPGQPSVLSAIGMPSYSLRNPIYKF